VSSARVLIYIGFDETAAGWLDDALFRASSAYRPLDRSALAPLVRDQPLEFDAQALRRDLAPLLDRAGGAPVVAWARLSGDAASGGYDSKELADRLAAVFPGARILIVIREQRSAIAAAYKRYVDAGGQSTAQQFLHRTPQQGWRVPSFDFGHFEYDRLIRYYRSLFGDENVLVLVHEQLADDGRRAISAISEFAGQPSPERVPPPVADGAGSALTTALTRPLNRFAPRSELSPEPFLPVKALFWLGAQGRKAPISLARSEEKLHAVVAEAVGDRYVESNRVTAKLLGIDLRAYGWMV
jgi:hypothetical protein